MTRAARPPVQDIVTKVISRGDLNDLHANERIIYYLRICRTLGLNAETLPFSFYEKEGRLHLYATKRCTQQLAKKYSVSIHKLEWQIDDCILTFTAYARLPNGREDVDCGSVDIAGLKGLELSNARMTAATKAKRRVVLSLCGLGMLDELEVGTIPNVRVYTVDPDDISRVQATGMAMAMGGADGPMSRHQLQDLTRALGLIGFERKEDTRKFMEWLVGRSLEVQRMLSSREAAQVLLRLGHYDAQGVFYPDEHRIRDIYEAFVERLRSQNLN
ncbi:hypothetical protein [Deinococcus alpinitundrae]|uniref:hypothetical protein n=1 Tax=Deinococcus alpinitundrae TaxID=468913 RepID=UPI001379B088|nr:hypothetical protein [Deinococcus alpinitundrae]